MFPRTMISVLSKIIIIGNTEASKKLARAGKTLDMPASLEAESGRKINLLVMLLLEKKLVKIVFIFENTNPFSGFTHPIICQRNPKKKQE